MGTTPLMAPGDSAAGTRLRQWFSGFGSLSGGVVAQRGCWLGSRPRTTHHGEVRLVARTSSAPAAHVLRITLATPRVCSDRLRPQEHARLAAGGLVWLGDASRVGSCSSACVLNYSCSGSCRHREMTVFAGARLEEAGHTRTAIR